MKAKFLFLITLSLAGLTSVEAQTCNGLQATIVGSGNNDDIRGTSGVDIIVGLGGDDRIEGLAGDDVICGGEGDDDLLGDAGDDQLFGGAGNDVIEGGDDDDICDGITGVDSASLDCEIRNNIDTNVFAVTLFADDGTQLDGALYVPIDEAAAQGTRQVAMIVSHGAMGSFDSSIPKIMGLQASPLGFPVLALNRRDWGPDGGGGAVLFEDATLDIGVGIELLDALGYREVYVAGHSQGTQNATVYPSFSMDPRVAGVGLYGTVDDGRSTAQDLLFQLTYDQDVVLAKQLIAEGRGDDIVAWPTIFEVDLFRSPNNYLSFWGPDTLSVVEREITRLEVPALLMRADGDNFTPDAMSQNVMAAADAAGIDATYVVLDYPFPLTDFGGNAHGFVGVEREMMRTTLTWLVDKIPEAGMFTTDTKLAVQNPPGNFEPVADAGAVSFVAESSPALLDGSGSFDIDGAVVSWLWTQLSGDPVVIDSADSAYATFTTPATEQASRLLVFQVTVTDDDGGTGSDQVQVFVTEDEPVNAGRSTSSLDPVAIAVLLWFAMMRAFRNIRHGWN